MVKNQKKAARPRKEIVLFIVEGRSDKETLRFAISELYDKIDSNIIVEFPSIDYRDQQGGDITCLRYKDRFTNNINKVTPEYITKDICDLILNPFFDRYKIYPKDLTEIIQIVDLDGAYIPDENVIENKNLDKIIYKWDKIECPKKDNILRRNEQKRNNLDFLCSLSEIKVGSKSIPYSVFYFSSNLDHFVHHNANLDGTKKRDEAYAFSMKFMQNIEGFIKYFSEDPCAAREMTRNESWEFIKQGTNSLSRHTNIDILLKELYSENAR